MRYTIEPKENAFTPLVISIIVETPGELIELAKALDTLPDDDGINDLVDDVQEEANKWKEEE